MLKLVINVGQFGSVGLALLSGSIRELIHIPFRIVYTIESKIIYVVRVWRSERLLKLADSSNDWSSPDFAHN